MNSSMLGQSFAAPEADLIHHMVNHACTCEIQTGVMLAGASRTFSSEV